MIRQSQRSRVVRQCQAAVDTVLAALAHATPTEREAISVALRPLTNPGALRQSMTAMAEQALADSPAD